MDAKLSKNTRTTEIFINNKTEIIEKSVLCFQAHLEPYIIIPSIMYKINKDIAYNNKPTILIYYQSRLTLTV